MVDFLERYCKFNDKEWVKNEFHAFDFLTYRQGNTFPKVILFDSTVSKEGRDFFFRKIKSDEKTRQIPVIILETSKGFDDRCDRQIGINTYTVKLSEFSDLIKRMKEVVPLDSCLIA